MKHEETENESQCEASRISHKELVPFSGIAEHVVEPEYAQYAECGDGQQYVRER